MNMRQMRRAILCAALASAFQPVMANDDGPVKVGVLTDMTGFLSAGSGTGSVEAAKMAIEDFGGSLLGKRIELLSSDHQNKPDIGLATARKWYESEGVDAIADFGNSAVAMGVQELTRSKKKIAMYVGASSSALTGKACSPYGTQWAHDSYMFGTTLPARLTSKGDKDWFLLTADFAFGQALEAEAKRTILANGGKVVGNDRHPPNTTDFSSYLLKASSSGAKVVALANAATDTVNAIKQWREFQFGGKDQKLVALTLFIHDVRSLGLPAAQGTIFPTMFYWDLNDETRAFARRYAERNKGAMPSEVQASTYSAVMHYLKAVKAANTKDADAVRQKMMELPVNDFFTSNARVRADGRVARVSYIAEVKKPSESKGPWDLFKILETVPADKTWIPLESSECPLVKK